MTFAVRAHDFASVLDAAPDGIEILSLDCFDTLLWRNTNLPVDVFADLPLPGSGVEARIWGETRARRAIPLLEERIEVSIEDIYAYLMPGASAAERAAMIEAELDAEARHCYAFAPTVALMRAAKARGLRIILVSDTYLSAGRLRTLIVRAAGADVVAMIDRIFCSSEHGMPKAAGLFVPVLAALGASPSTILHCGDNKTADVDAPSRLGIHCCHLQQFDEESEQRLRLEATAAAILDPATRSRIPTCQPHRAAIAMRRDDDPATRLGHDVLGPIFHSFADWLHDEAAAQAERTGKPTKLLFLLRDGYLPAQAYLARHPQAADQVAMVDISRLTAAQAGMIDRAAIETHVLPDLPKGSTEVFARHLHFSREEAAKLAARGKNAFAAFIRKPEVVARIVDRSRAFADRLIAHLASHGVAPGDSVMFVDLGYEGTVQNLIQPMLEARLGLTVSGRYLILRETALKGHDKAGFADSRHHDLRTLQALTGSIAIVEQLCTRAQGSVLDYRADGSPVHDGAGLKAAQSATRAAIQSACLDYVAREGAGFGTRPASDTPDARRRMAIAALARLLFLPVASEVAVLGDFDHDVNLGTDETIRFIDTEAAASGLRRRGLFYIKNALRTYLAGELRDHGLPINLSIFTSRRFGLDLRKTDFDVGGIKLPVMLMAANGEHAVMEFDAIPTADGYYQALVPIGAGRFTAGVQLGRIADWVQVDELSFHYVDGFLDATTQENPLPAESIPEGLEDMGGGLLRCTGGDAAFMLVPPPIGADAGQPLLLSVVFRPVVRKSRAAARLRAAA